MVMDVTMPQSGTVSFCLPSKYFLSDHHNQN